MTDFIIPPSLPPTPTAPKDMRRGRGYSTQEIAAAIGGGYMEIVYRLLGTAPSFVDNDISSYYMIVDEDGHRKKLETNVVASVIAGQTIVGSVLLCDKGHIS